MPCLRTVTFAQLSVGMGKLQAVGTCRPLANILHCGRVVVLRANLGGLQDLYVLRRAMSVYQAIIRRLTAQTTDYRVLLSTFAEGLFTEMDFQNEALNALRMQVGSFSRHDRFGWDSSSADCILKQHITEQWASCRNSTCAISRLCSV